MDRRSNGRSSGSGGRLWQTAPSLSASSKIWVKLALGRAAERDSHCVGERFPSGSLLGRSQIFVQLQNLSTDTIDGRVWMLIMYPVFVGLALLRNLSVLSKLVPVGMVAALATAVCIVWKSLMEVEVSAALGMAQGAKTALGAALATCLGAFTIAPRVPFF